MPYRVAGKMLHDGAPQIVLAKGDAVVTAREGETLDDGYRVESIRRDHVTLLYVPLGLRQRLPLTSSFFLDEPFTDATAGLPPQAPAVPPAMAQGAPAQLRWAGPAQVRAGDPFSVSLRVSSGQPVRVLPLQLSYDAALLEPVDVRPGSSFSGGLFSYRINPAGSIFIGAAGKDAAVSDAELLIVTFKPLGTAASAELKISSALQGDPDAFRTAIVH